MASNLTIGISRADGEIVVLVLRFIIQGCVGFQLPCVGINAKRCSIGPAQRIGQCIAFRIRRLEGIVDGCADGYVLHNGECDLSLRESWWFIDIRDVYCDGDAIATVVAIRNRNRQRVGIVFFIV